MIRIIIDEFGEGHQDCWLKIDSVPIISSVFDSYFLSDFLELKFDTKGKSQNEITKIEIRELISYWKLRVETCLPNQETILAYDISDEYIGALSLKRNKLGFETSMTYTRDVRGCEISKSSLDKLIDEEKVKFNDATKAILLSRDGILESFSKSLKSLE